MALYLIAICCLMAEPTADPGLDAYMARLSEQRDRMMRSQIERISKMRDGTEKRQAVARLRKIRTKDEVDHVSLPERHRVGEVGVLGYRYEVESHVGTDAVIVTEFRHERSNLPNPGSFSPDGLARRIQAAANTKLVPYRQVLFRGVNTAHLPVGAKMATPLVSVVGMEQVGKKNLATYRVLNRATIEALFKKSKD